MISILASTMSWPQAFAIAVVAISIAAALIGICKYG